MYSLKKKIRIFGGYSVICSSINILQIQMKDEKMWKDKINNISRFKKKTQTSNDLSEKKLHWTKLNSQGKQFEIRGERNQNVGWTQLY